VSRFIIVCGGTGGHLSPGIAIAELLESKGHQCLLLISRKEVDSRLVAKYQTLHFKSIPGTPFSLKPLGLMRFLRSLFSSFLHSWKLMRRWKPDVVLGLGGFLSAGMVLMASVCKVPVALHEANRKPGRAIRFLGRFSTRLYLPAGVEIKGVSTGKIRRYGYPVRKEFRPLSKKAARKKIGIPLEGTWLIILGGSQGATPLNEWVDHNYISLLNKGLNIYCVRGLHKGAEGVLEYRGGNGEVRYYYSVPFSDDVNALMHAADLVVSRAGAGAIAEITRCRLPSLLIPYPLATDNHQLENARFLETQGGCVVLEQQYLNSLLGEIFELINNDWLLEKMKSNLAKVEDYNRKEDIVRDLEALAVLRAAKAERKCKRVRTV